MLPPYLGFRKYFALRQISYQFFDVETDTQAAQAVQTIGKLKFPMVVVGEKERYWNPQDPAVVLKNPRLAELEAALSQWGLAQAKPL
jgi:glutaredoxin